MPLIESTYAPGFPFRSGHWATMYASKLRRIGSPYTARERLELPDGDFVDIDLIIRPEVSQYVVLLHGLEGNSARTYMKGAALALQEASWNVIALNYRGCSGTPNRLYHSYNAGQTEDLEFLIAHLQKTYSPSKLALVGFSLGGNLLLKYLGSKQPGWQQIDRAVAISAPLDLRATLMALSRKENWVYRTVFLRSLKKKLLAKAKAFPDRIDLETVKTISSLLAFDNRYTAPAHGFNGALEYYEKSSCGPFLEYLETPCLLINATNDSFLKRTTSFPRALASTSDHLFLELPQYGGHVGFIAPKNYYSEQKILEFLND